MQDETCSFLHQAYGLLTVTTVQHNPDSLTAIEEDVEREAGRYRVPKREIGFVTGLNLLVSDFKLSV